MAESDFYEPIRQCLEALFRSHTYRRSVHPPVSAGKDAAGGLGRAAILSGQSPGYHSLGVIFTLDTTLAVVALGGSYVRMLSVIIPGASMIFGFAFSRIHLARYRSRFGPPAGQRSAMS
jgi:hypothetical protein